MDVTATWEGDRYVCNNDERWWSDDGDEWRHCDGILASGDRFDEANIKLVGGPHDGEWRS